MTDHLLSDHVADTHERQKVEGIHADLAFIESGAISFAIGINISPGCGSQVVQAKWRSGESSRLLTKCGTYLRVTTVHLHQRDAVSEHLVETQQIDKPIAQSAAKRAWASANRSSSRRCAAC